MDDVDGVDERSKRNKGFSYRLDGFKIGHCPYSLSLGCHDILISLNIMACVPASEWRDYGK